MTNTTVALVFVMTLNIFMWFSQVAIVELSDVNPMEFYNCEGSMIESFGNCTSRILTATPEDNLPIAQGTVNPSTESSFTDIFNSALSWIKNIPGVNFLYSMLKAPYSILQGIGAPSEIAFGLGVLWYGISLFLLVAFLWGKE